MSKMGSHTEGRAHLRNSVWLTACTPRNCNRARSSALEATTNLSSASSFSDSPSVPGNSSRSSCKSAPIPGESCAEFQPTTLQIISSCQLPSP